MDVYQYQYDHLVKASLTRPRPPRSGDQAAHYSQGPTCRRPCEMLAAWSRVHVGSLLTRETAASAPASMARPRNDDRLLAPLVAVVA